MRRAPPQRQQHRSLHRHDPIGHYCSIIAMLPSGCRMSILQVMAQRRSRIWMDGLHDRWHWCIEGASAVGAWAGGGEGPVHRQLQGTTRPRMLRELEYYRPMLPGVGANLGRPTWGRDTGAGNAAASPPRGRASPPPRGIEVSDEFMSTSCNETGLRHPLHTSIESHRPEKASRRVIAVSAPYAQPIRSPGIPACRRFRRSSPGTSTAATARLAPATPAPAPQPPGRGVPRSRSSTGMSGAAACG